GGCSPSPRSTAPLGSRSTTRGRRSCPGRSASLTAWLKSLESKDRASVGVARPPYFVHFLTWNLGLMCVRSEAREAFRNMTARGSARKRYASRFAAKAAALGLLAAFVIANAALAQTGFNPYG